MIFMRRVLTTLALITWGGLVTGSAQAQEAATGDGAVSAPRSTLESIMERQKSRLEGTVTRLPEALNRVQGKPVPVPGGDAGVPQLGTLGGASDPDLWRALKAGAPTTPSSSTASGQVMQVLGDDWRLVRRQYIPRFAGYVLLGTLALIILFRLIRGQIKIRSGRAGKTIPRFSMSHRIAHWFLASVFILMGLSGLIILFGRPILVDFLGRDLLAGRFGMDPSIIDTMKALNSVLLSASMQGHNLFGPVFVLAWAILVIRFLRGNFFQWADAKWILKGGGLLGGHASSHHYNFGEKTWYWMVALIGLGMSVTGVFLLFPWLSATLAFHQAATILHAVGAVLLVAVAMGHAYIGTVGMEGSIDSMLRGEVDENWAREHHDLWYEEMTGKAADRPEDDTPKAQAEGTA